jgi:hypothetical protein
VASGSSLFSELPVEGSWNVNRGANGILFHSAIISHVP